MMRDESHAFFVFIGYVIANQSSDWCGDPPDIAKELGDCHGPCGPRNDMYFKEAKYETPICKSR